MGKISIFVFSLAWLLTTNFNCRPVKVGLAQNFPSAQNAKGDLAAENWGDQIVFNWGRTQSAAGYNVYRSESITGPWVEILRITDNSSTTTKVDITPDARLKNLCYMVRAVNESGQVIYMYQPICVPKFNQYK